jgi:DNA-binding GntR family transcriptional regulator
MSNLKKRAYEHVRRKLAGDFLSPGARLSPKSLAKEIGISHTPVREALSQLQSEGLLVARPQKGMFVRQPGRDELVEIIELRTILEVHAAAEAARRIRDAELDQLERNIDELGQLAEAIAASDPNEAPALLPRWMVADLAFHLTILTVGGNRRVVQVVNDARILTRMFGFRADDPARWDNVPAYFAENYQVHRDVFSAIEKRDGKLARRAMAAHMRLTRRSLLARFDCMQQKQDANDPLFQELPESLREHIRATEQAKPRE